MVHEYSITFEPWQESLLLEHASSLIGFEDEDHSNVALKFVVVLIVETFLEMLSLYKKFGYLNRLIWILSL